MCDKREIKLKMNECMIKMGVKVFFFFVIILSEGFLITLVICVYE